jgi:primosomal protein N' (replication factor Y)
VPLAYHAREPSLVCHTCGYRREAPLACPACGGHDWRFGGFGIERAQSEFRRLFPDVPLYRLDRDVSREEPASRVLTSFAAERPSCLLATTMAFGFPPVPGVGLAAVLSCDTLLNLPDYRASEKVFHVLSSVAEMVDGSLPGAAFVAQTYNPEHAGVRGIMDPEAFYRTELENRRAFGYPPFKSFFLVHFSGRSLERVAAAARTFAGMALERGGDLDVLGPNPSFRPKARGDHRWQVALRGPDHSALASLCRGVVGAIGPSGAVKITVDVDPVDMA